MLRKNCFILICALIAVFNGGSAFAEKIYIDITSPAFKKLPIAIQQFSGSKETSEIIKADMTFTGMFDCLEDAAHIERPDQTFSATSWRGLGVEMVVKGAASVSGSTIELNVSAYDVAEGREVFRKAYSSKKDLMRPLAHAIANDLYKLMTGQQGLFRTKIAFVAEKSGSKALYLMDFDGERMTPLGPRAGIMLAPRWSPDSSKLLYSAEKKRKWGIYLYDFNTSTELSAMSLSGLTIAGNFYQDGRRFIYSSSKDGNADLYIGNIGGSPARKILGSPWIDVSPSISPDNLSILFVSNRTGAPQLYLADNQGYGIRRITMEGNYNTAPSWSPAGDRIVFTSMTGGRNQIFTIKPDGTDMTQITRDGNNEDPSFSPDGRFIVFSSTREGSKALFIIRANGEGIKRITPKGFRASSPGWSPY